MAVVVTTVGTPVVAFLALQYVALKDSWYDDELVRRLRTVLLPSSQIHDADVTGPLVDVFPDGMTADSAIRFLNTNGFSCATVGEVGGAELRCRRVVSGFPCAETWTFRLALSRDHTIVDRKATLRSICV